MTSAPQSVTDRYTRNLLISGQNDRYEIVTVSRQINQVDNIPTGIYFTVTITVPTANFIEHVGLGATPVCALRRALEKAGVTFR